MLLLALSVAVFFAKLAFAKKQPDDLTTGLTTPAHILVGFPKHISVANRVQGFPFSIDKEVTGIPSWMTFSYPNLLYAVDESSNALTLFEINFFNTDNTRLVGCAYGNGTIDIWNTTNGGLGLIKTVPSPGQPGPDKERQASPHPHQANLDPTGRFFVINDLGTDSMVVLDSNYDAFQIVNIIHISPQGCGPRHGVFYPQGAFRATHYILVCEISNKVLVYTVSYRENYLDFTEIQSTSTFGPGLPPANSSSAAAGAIVLAADNRHLYVSNRQTGNSTDSVSHFQINHLNSTFLSLQFVGSASTYGISPRMMSFSHGDRYLLIANQAGGFGLVALERRLDGTLEAENPVSVLGAPDFTPQFVQQIT
ncbi:Lactonase, 7-bladed beta-propeller-domain-containing protein [Fusarium oxysporum Fo47]|uniref:Lactonase, 7-bladed beta-propeller-domain-containing protein n=1 Tax=Fusarium oxysporum Fo47 TaxID=660027 RepID=UPI002869DE80|nr:Lactonase, 7-bladed beta-propeller-domain-containing protein [Fusarium oxysporum Fo47]WJG35434.1 Lactonase, 7-bladed beta-propeller-domain-containing protein [Fusarium oxysporum Fo47]